MTKRVLILLCCLALCLPAWAESPAPTRTPPGPWAQTGDVATEGFPELTTQGFLPEGQPEYVFEDAENGLWRYASQDLRIVIRRVEENKVRHLAAEIFLREGAEGLRMYPFGEAFTTVDRKRDLDAPYKMARQKRVVFSMDGDYYLYRARRHVNTQGNYAIGVVIRDGEILFNVPPSDKRTSYPPLDLLALYPDGDMQVYKVNEYTAEELLAMGARDVLSFGPWLVRDGQINDTYSGYGTSLQPRAGVGMFARGHYLAIIVEGRIKQSRGMTTREIGDLFKACGCTTAFNLDGGWTSAMIFMGKQLNQLDNNGVKNNARDQNEIMGIGTTAAFDGEGAP